jgi:hypothetical protein
MEFVNEPERKGGSLLCPRSKMKDNRYGECFVQTGAFKKVASEFKEQRRFSCTRLSQD